MSVWLCIPSIRPFGGTIPVWKAAGYKIAVLRQGEPIDADIHIHTDEYRGWAASINLLMRAAFKADPQCDWCVGGGDDTLPDPNHTPEDISKECSMCSIYFGQGWQRKISENIWSDDLSTFGVMQPIGDLKLWPNSRIDRFAGSPWIGREFARRVCYPAGAEGPLFPYPHCFADEDLQNVAIKLGVFWQRPDLLQEHRHWQRGAEDKPVWWDATAGADYHNSRALFEQRKKAGFPCEVIA